MLAELAAVRAEPDRGWPSSIVVGLMSSITAGRTARLTCDGPRVTIADAKSGAACYDVSLGFP